MTMIAAILICVKENELPVNKMNVTMIERRTNRRRYAIESTFAANNTSPE